MFSKKQWDNYSGTYASAQSSIDKIKLKYSPFCGFYKGLSSLFSHTCGGSVGTICEDMDRWDLFFSANVYLSNYTIHIIKENHIISFRKTNTSCGAFLQIKHSTFALKKFLPLPAISYILDAPPPNYKVLAEKCDKWQRV